MCLLSNCVFEKLSFQIFSQVLMGLFVMVGFAIEFCRELYSSLISTFCHIHGKQIIFSYLTGYLYILVIVSFTEKIFYFHAVDFAFVFAFFAN